ncbi:MAG: tetratricopeptide repeat protein [Crocinitomicaceae bacterium]
MTDNHLLIYRFAELMLEHEQHVLPVDLLFDDEKIADFVKSIQIDSPYQQMLLEGVLTESVRDEKLFVSFTVEGYFHYVLGEVIYQQTSGMGPKALQDFLMHNQLNGIRQGIEQCLIRDVQKNDLSRLIWLIDEGGKALEISSYPLAQAFLIHPIDSIMEMLLSDTTENDITALENTIQKLEEWQKNEEVKTIYRILSKFILPNTFKNLSILIDSIEYLELEQGLHLLTTLKNSLHKFENIEEEQLIYQEIGIQFLNKDDYKNAEIYLSRSIELEQKINRRSHIKKEFTGRLYSYLCSLWIAKKEYDKALKHYKKELNYLLRSADNEENNLLLVYNNLGYVYSDLYDNSSREIHSSKAEMNYEKSLSIRNKIFGKYHPSTAIIYNNLGLLYSKKGELQKSEKLHTDSLEIRKRIFGNNSPTDISYNNLSILFSKKGDIQSAINFGENALSIRIKELGLYNSKTGRSFNNLAWYYYELQEYDKSLKYVKNAIKIRKKIFGFFDFDVAESYILLSYIYSDLNNYTAAITYQAKAIKIQLKQLDPNDSKIGLSYTNLGSLHESNGNIKNAITNFKKALKIELFNKGINNSETGLTFFTIANLYLSNKDYKKALDFFKKGFQSNKDSGGFPFRIGICYEKLNQLKEAIQYYCLSAELRKKSLGVDDEATQSVILEAFRLAEESNNLMLLPEWMKEITNDL